MNYYTLLAVVIFAACQPTTQDSHSHDASGGHSHGDEVLIKKTLSTDSLEVYLEYQPLIVGSTSRFEIHLTLLNGFQPVPQAKVTLSLIQGTHGIRQTVDEPHSLGTFTPALQPNNSGLHTMQLDIETPSWQQKLVLDSVKVYENQDQLLSSGEIPADLTDLINFTKENAWNTAFAAQAVNSAEIYEMVPASGVWRATPGGNKTLNATVSGVVNYAINNLTEGVALSKGQLLMSISSEGFTAGNLQADIAKAEADHQKSHLEYERKKQLLEENIIARAEFEEIENEHAVALTSLETLKAGYSSGSKLIRTPFEGFVQRIVVENGDYVEEGDELLVVGTTNARILETHLGPAYISKLDSIHNLWYTVKPGVWSDLISSGGKILSVGQEITRDEPLIPIFAQVNERIESPLGGISEVQISLGSPRKNIVIPESALLEEYGNYYVMIQVSGEQYQRRPVSVGRRNGPMIEILKGLQEQEIVVIQGAFQVKMAGMADQAPGHGHSH